MQRLADVELQLVMQGLTAQEILTLARCSRYLLHAADAPFAWRYTRLCFGDDAKPVVPPPTVALPQRILGWCQRMLLLAQKPKPPQLLRHAKVSIIWRADDVISNLRALEIASRIPAIYEINAAWCSGTYALNYTNFLFSLPSTQQLRVLSACDNLYPAIIKAIIQLPHLHTLHLRDTSFPSVSGLGLELLYQAPALTSLHIQDKPERLMHVAACSKLTDLSVLEPRLDGFAWSVFFAHPHIQQLHSLKLDLLSFKHLNGPTHHDFQIAFANMHHLHTLHLARCDGVDLVLPALAHAPVLCRLTIKPHLTRFCAYGIGIDSIDTKTAPSALVLAALLIAAPRLHCVLDLGSLNGSRKECSALRQRLTKRFAFDAIFNTDQFKIQS